MFHISRRHVCAAFFCTCVSLSTTGCGKAVQVIVPDDFHGDLVVHCTSAGASDRVLHANSNGVADGVCPSMGNGIQVFRGGEEVLLSGSPAWTRTRDGIPTAIHIDVN